MTRRDNSVFLKTKIKLLRNVIYKPNRGNIASILYGLMVNYLMF